MARRDVSRWCGVWPFHGDLGVGFARGAKPTPCGLAPRERFSSQALALPAVIARAYIGPDTPAAELNSGVRTPTKPLRS